jgi:hypothetical protein
VGEMMRAPSPSSVVHFIRNSFSSTCPMPRERTTPARAHARHDTTNDTRTEWVGPFSFGKIAAFGGG